MLLGEFFELDPIRTAMYNGGRQCREDGTPISTLEVTQDCCHQSAALSNILVLAENACGHQHPEGSTQGLSERGFETRRRRSILRAARFLLQESPKQSKIRLNRFTIQCLVAIRSYRMLKLQRWRGYCVQTPYGPMASVSMQSGASGQKRDRTLLCEVAAPVATSVRLNPARMSKDAPKLIGVFVYGSGFSWEQLALPQFKHPAVDDGKSACSEAKPLVLLHGNAYLVRSLRHGFFVVAALYLPRFHHSQEKEAIDIVSAFLDSLARLLGEQVFGGAEAPSSARLRELLPTVITEQTLSEIQDALAATVALLLGTIVANVILISSRHSSFVP